MLLLSVVRGMSGIGSRGHVVRIRTAVNIFLGGRKKILTYILVSPCVKLPCFSRNLSSTDGFERGTGMHMASEPWISNAFNDLLFLVRNAKSDAEEVMVPVARGGDC